MIQCEKLTEILKDSDVCEYFTPYKYFRLAEHLLNYGVIVPPCNIGDIVYTNCAMQGWYKRQKDKPYSAEVVFIGINSSKDMGYGFINVMLGEGQMLQFNFSDFGKTVFITKEEATKALTK